MSKMKPKLIELLIQCLHHVTNNKSACQCDLCACKPGPGSNSACNLIYWTDYDKGTFTINFQNDQHRSRHRHTDHLYELYDKFVGSSGTVTDPKTKMKSHLNKACADGASHLSDQTGRKKAYIAKTQRYTSTFREYQFVSEGISLLKDIWGQLDENPFYLWDIDAIPTTSSPEFTWMASGPGTSSDSELNAASTQWVNGDTSNPSSLELMSIDNFDFMCISNDIPMDDIEDASSSKPDSEEMFKAKFKLFALECEGVSFEKTAHRRKCLLQIAETYKRNPVDLLDMLSTRIEVYTNLSSEPNKTFNSCPRSMPFELCAGGFRIFSHPHFKQLNSDKVEMFGPSYLQDKDDICIQSAVCDIPTDKEAIRALFEAFELQSLCFIWRKYEVIDLPPGCDPVIPEILDRISWKLYCFNLVKTARKPGENGKLYKLKMCIETPLGGCKELQYGEETEVFDFGALLARMTTSQESVSRAFIGVGHKNIAKDGRIRLRFVLTNSFLERLHLPASHASHISEDTASSASTAI